MKDGKSPGNDGLTRELFISFFGEIAPLLIQSLTLISMGGIMPPPIVFRQYLRNDLS